ncbi:MAG TPA: hypothetical protein PLL06_04610 [Acidobacteriota bacterium]|nr:hypothetical protein [Acidobacteriota bacterium]HMZ78958.1 hypothetical protein [Acidobacteriota bacterium]HNB70048.1 hypothetical protein [Acidobacteriota bacterium]HNC44302.1 hypothetical protein [Acidobacteriota bacterium]HND17823.1 hypothetical protein [Acidobacteriota bacterium]
MTTQLKFILTLRHVRVLPKLFMLIERLGAECTDMQGHLVPGAGGRLHLTLDCPQSRAHRLRPQIERLVDVTELYDAEQATLHEELLFQSDMVPVSALVEGSL